MGPLFTERKTALANDGEEQRRRSPAGSGFALIEVLLALVLLGISFAVLVGSPISSLQSDTHSRRVSAATNLARDKLEDLRGTDYASLSTGADSQMLTAAGDLGGVSDPEAIFSRSWTVASGPITGTRAVTVTVAWGVSGRHVDLETVMRDWE